MASTVETTSVSRMHKRNVVVLGKTGAGKSTIANKILETTDERTSDRPFEVSHAVMTSVTEGTTASTAVLRTSEGVEYLVQVVDTVGLFDTRPDRSNITIMREIKSYFKERLPDGLNLVLFVFKQGRWTEEEQKTFDFISSHFVAEVSSISALVITGCDGYTDEMKANLISEFRRLQPKIADFMKQGIHPVAFPDITKLKAQIQEAHEQYQKIDQDILRKLVYSSKESKLSKEVLQDTFWEKVGRCTFL